MQRACMRVCVCGDICWFSVILTEKESLQKQITVLFISSCFGSSKYETYGTKQSNRTSRELSEQLQGTYLFIKHKLSREREREKLSC